MGFDINWRRTAPFKQAELDACGTSGTRIRSVLEPRVLSCFFGLFGSVVSLFVLPVWNTNTACGITLFRVSRLVFVQQVTPSGSVSHGRLL